MLGPLVLLSGLLSRAAGQTCSSGHMSYTHPLLQTNDATVVKNCNLGYCNAFSTLQSTYCNNALCTTEQQSTHCSQHWSDAGRVDNTYASVFNLDDCRYPLNKTTTAVSHPFTDSTTTLWTIEAQDNKIGNQGYRLHETIMFDSANNETLHWSASGYCKPPLPLPPSYVTVDTYGVIKSKWAEGDPAWSDRSYGMTKIGVFTTDNLWDHFVQLTVSNRNVPSIITTQIKSRVVLISENPIVWRNSKICPQEWRAVPPASRSHASGGGSGYLQYSVSGQTYNLIFCKYIDLEPHQAVQLPSNGEKKFVFTKNTQLEHDPLTVDVDHSIVRNTKTFFVLTKRYQLLQADYRCSNYVAPPGPQNGGYALFLDASDPLADTDRAQECANRCQAEGHSHFYLHVGWSGRCMCGSDDCSSRVHWAGTTDSYTIVALAKAWTDRGYGITHLGFFTPTNFEYFIQQSVAFRTAASTITSSVRARVVVVSEAPSLLGTWTKIFDGECTDGSELLMYNGVSDNPGTDEASRTKACAEACLNKNTVLSSGSWDGFNAAGFIVFHKEGSGPNGRCWCEDANSNSCSNTVGDSDFDRYDFTVAQSCPSEWKLAPQGSHNYGTSGAGFVQTDEFGVTSNTYAMMDCQYVDVQKHQNVTIMANTGEKKLIFVQLLDESDRVTKRWFDNLRSLPTNLYHLPLSTCGFTAERHFHESHSNYWLTEAATPHKIQEKKNNGHIYEYEYIPAEDVVRWGSVSLPLVDLGDEGCIPSLPCGQCEGDCDDDTDCIGTLQCFNRHDDSFATPPGCTSSGAGDRKGIDYCFENPATKPLITIGASACTPSLPCGQCEGDCNTDNDCRGGLICQQRTSEIIPGCYQGHNLLNGIFDYDYCTAHSDLIEHKSTAYLEFKRVVGGKTMNEWIQCDLTYCNKNLDLRASFCQGQACSTREQAMSCHKHWLQYGQFLNLGNSPVDCQMSPVAIQSSYSVASCAETAVPILFHSGICRGTAQPPSVAGFVRDGGGAGLGEVYFATYISFQSCVTKCAEQAAWGCNFISWQVGLDAELAWCYIHQSCENKDFEATYRAYIPRHTDGPSGQQVQACNNKFCSNGITTGMTTTLTFQHCEICWNDWSSVNVGSMYAAGSVQRGYCQNQNVATCTICPAGKWQDANGHSFESCKDCPRGFSSVANRDRCEDCFIGFFQSLPRQANCLECPSGQYTMQNQATGCNMCPTGKFSPTILVNGEQRVECKNCGTGMYSDTNGSGGCKSCASGMYGIKSQAVSAIDGCVDCQRGTYNDQVDQDQCIDCPKGWSQTLAGQNTCDLCPAGQTTALFKQFSCVECAVGKYLSIAMRGTDSSCLPCSGALVEGVDTCAGCPAGKKGTCDDGCESSDKCTTCEVGRFATGGNRQECDPCPKGYYGKNPTSRFKCEFCLAGTYNPIALAENVSFCMDCVAGKYSALRGQDDVSACQDCHAGRYNYESGSDHPSKCLPCKAGYYSVASRARDRPCVGCDSGFFVPTRGVYVPCSRCPAGYHKAEANGTTCDACLPGKSQPTSGNANCEDCEPGFHTNNIKFLHCVACEQGMYQPLAAQASCLPCVPGLSNHNVGVIACTACAKNTFAKKIGQLKCQHCPEGRSASVGQAICSVCGSGTYKFNESCFACPKGYHQHKQDQEICLKCSPGAYATQEQMANCLECNPGTYENDINSTECKSCVAGMSQTLTGQSECSDCVFGQFSSEMGAVSCLECNPGTYENETKSNQCKSCVPGRSQTTTGQHHCNDCNVGRYSFESSAVDCLDCNPGMYQPKEQQNHCIMCHIGQYVKESKSIQCKSCAVGLYTLKSGQTSCTECGAGKHGLGNGCVECPTGWSRGDGDDLTFCTQCTLGQTTDAKGATTCIGCALGKFGDSEPGTCSDCVAGQYQDSRGATNCVDCPQDTYSAVEMATSKAECIFCSRYKTTGVNETGKTVIEDCVCKKDIYYQENNDCLTCPTGGTCSLHDGVTIDYVFPEPGYWRSGPNESYFSPCKKALVGLTDSIQMAKTRCCPINETTNVSQCSTGLLHVTHGVDNAGWNQDHQCLTGYVGPLCMICDVDFIRVGNDCQHCPGGSSITGAIMSGLAVCVMLMFFVVFRIRNTHATKKLAEDHVTERDHFVGEIVILISYMQILSGLTRTYGGAVEYPQEYVSFTSSMTVVNFDLGYAMPFAHCSLSLPYHEKLILHMATPLAFFLTVKFSSFVANIQCCKRNDIHTSTLSVEKANNIKEAQRNIGGTIILQLGMLLYPSLMNRVFSAFRCFPVEMGGGALPRYFLEGDFSIQCFSNASLHGTLIIPLAVVAVLVYTIGFPLFVVWELWRHRASLHDVTHPHYSLTRLRLGSLFEAFENNFWYWQPIIILYKMMMVGMLSVIEQHSPIQLFCGFLISFAYLLLVLRASPYVDANLDRLSFFTSLSMCLTLLFGLLKSMDEHRADALESDRPWEVPDALFSSVLVGVNILPFVYAGVSTSLRWFEHRDEILAEAKSRLNDVTKVAPMRELKRRFTKKSINSDLAPDQDQALRSWG